MRAILFQIFSILTFLSLLSCSGISVNNKENESIADIDAVSDENNEAEIFIDGENDSDSVEDQDIFPDDESGCVCDTVEGDEDGDGIPNTVEGCEDHDWDNLPDCMDEDSDGDGIADKRECPAQPCPDTDEDGTPNYLDRDSDNDHSYDRRENNEGTNPYLSDTDGDGTKDGVENKIGTDPLDPESRPPDGIYYVILDYYGDEEKLLIDFTTSGTKLDIVTMFDVTGSMQYSFEKIKEQVLSVINEDLPAREDDFFAFGIVEAPYNVVLPVTLDKDVVNASISEVIKPYGNYEILLETVYQTTVGDGFSSQIGYYAFSSAFGIEDVNFPAQNCEGKLGNIGGVCFREGVDHLLILFTDQEINEILSEEEVKHTQYYDDVWVEGEAVGHNVQETLVAMSFNHVKILTVNTAFSCDDEGNNCEVDTYANDNHDYFSEMTGAVDLYGNSLSFHTTDRAGNGIRDKLADAIKALTEYAEKDVTLNFEGSYVSDDDDAYTTDVIKSFRPLQANPAENVEKFDDIFFYKVKPDTKLTFELILQIDSHFPGVPWDNVAEFTVKLISGDHVLGVKVVRFLYYIENGPVSLVNSKSSSGFCAN